ncbi:hypothetical protein GF325_12120 [Candidatus Bathyarchaeota archaeon]|nr:hypothetical protein [Candidatus Bathyarchaeota archaeon]
MLDQSKPGSPQFMLPGTIKRKFIHSVFHVQDPPCPRCNQPMDFTILENVDGNGLEYCRWYCKVPACGYKRDIELI